MKAPASYDTFQERCYYYFNNCFDSKINASDLDKFIMTMLGMTEAEYANYKPSNTYDGGTSNSLKKVYSWECGHDHAAWK